MPVPTDITAGTLTITNGSTAVTGVGTAWLASDLRQGDIILWIEGGDGFQVPILSDVPASQTALTLVEPWQGPTLTGARYRIRYQWDSSRVSAQSRQLIERLDNGNILALSDLEGPGVPVFNGPHSMEIVPPSSFASGDVYGPTSATDNQIALFDGATGKLIKDSGRTIASIVPETGSVTNPMLAEVQTARIKGRTTAGVGSVEDLTPSQTWGVLGTTPYANVPGTVRAALTGTANAIALTHPGSIVEGLSVRFRASAQNTGATTIAYNGSTAIACRTVTGAALPADYIRTDVDTVAVYDGAYWVLSRAAEIGSNYLRLENGWQECLLMSGPVSQNISASPFFRTDFIDLPYPKAFVSTPCAVTRSFKASGSGETWAVGGGTDGTPGLTTLSAMAFGNSNTAVIRMQANVTGKWY